MSPSLPLAARAPQEGGAPGADRHAAGRLLAGYSIEITGADRAVAEACEADIPPGAEVFVAYVPGESPERVIEAARRVAAKGLTPVPHIVARAFTGAAMLDDMLARFAGEAGVSRALVLAGDRPQAEGPFHASGQLVATGLFEKHGFRQLSFALHPEGHPQVAEPIMREALRAKLEAARSRGLETRLVSQFALDAEPILDRVSRLPGEAPQVPVRIGVAGPTSRKTLWKYALYCGVGNSLRAISRHGEKFAHLAANDDPEQLVREVALGLPQQGPRAPIEGLHIFTFGGVAKALAWANQLVADAAGANPSS